MVADITELVAVIQAMGSVTNEEKDDIVNLKWHLKQLQSEIALKVDDWMAEKWRKHDQKIVENGPNLPWKFRERKIS